MARIIDGSNFDARKELPLRRRPLFFLHIMHLATPLLVDARDRKFHRSKVSVATRFTLLTMRLAINFMRLESVRSIRCCKARLYTHRSKLRPDKSWIFEWSGYRYYWVSTTLCSFLFCIFLFIEVYPAFFHGWVRMFECRRSIELLLRRGILEVSRPFADCKSISALGHGTAPKRRKKLEFREAMTSLKHYATNHVSIVARPRNARGREEEVSGYSTSDDPRDVVCWTRTIDGQYCLQDYDTCPLHVTDCARVKGELWLAATSNTND